MLTQLNGNLSVGLYLPITRADEVNIIIFYFYFYFILFYTFSRPRTNGQPYSCLLSIVAEDAFCLPTRTRVK
jgi:hypothetical protein